VFRGAGRDKPIGLALLVVVVLTILAFLIFPSTALAGQTPAPLVVLDVPFVSQTELLCGGAAAAMVMRYWGERDVSATSFAHLVDRGRGGISTGALVGELAGRGWQALPVAGTDTLLENELARGRPVIALIEDRKGTFHYVVVVAASSTAVVFHDPARTPLRVLSRDRFSEQWAPAGRWMSVITPPASLKDPRIETPAVPAVPPSDDGVGIGSGAANRCEALIAEGVRLARAKNLESAERSLTSALSCPGPAALRELAGVRVLQNRWPDATELALAAVRADARDAFAWRLLATGRYVQNQPDTALEAWNAVGEPRLDLVSVAGLMRTRNRIIETALGVEPNDVLTLGGLRRGRRLLADVPGLVSASLGYVPLPAGRAELRAQVVERTLLPSTPVSWGALAVTALVAREVRVSSGPLFGGGERLGVDWRFWPGRPRLAVDLQAPTPWRALPGVWGVSFATERQPFDSAAFPTSERTGARMQLSSWATGALRWTVRGGFDEWQGRGRFAVVGGSLRAASVADRLAGSIDVDGWSGGASFATVSALTRLRSSNAREGFVYVGALGAGLVSASTPGDLWLAADTGRARPMLLRAHPLVESGRFRTARLGRASVYGTVEAQRWWRVPLVRLAGAVFADVASMRRRIDGAPLNDVDVGGGLRATVIGMTGVVRIDLAKGLRDGATRVSFVYEP
jgi:predicted double-glycine peptidase